MIFYADLHIHSPYSGGSSPRMTLDNIEHHARIKGISVVGTGDCFHPMWLQYLLSMDEDLDTGLLCQDVDAEKGEGVYFLPTVEVSCEKGRKRMHMLLFFPHLTAAAKSRSALLKYGNLDKDGRPALKLMPGELMDIVKSKFDNTIVVAAHILTPWTGILGDRNHFDSIYETMDVLPDAIETGLSADKGMVRSIGDIRDVPLLSFSDAHSLPNIGREVTKFKGDISWDNISKQIRAGDVDTIEYPPALGKYHFSGHAECKYSVGAGGRPLCPKCHKRLTMGVDQRVADLSSGTAYGTIEEYMIPLQHLIHMATNYPVGSEQASAMYYSIVKAYKEIPLLTMRYNIGGLKLDSDLKELIIFARNRMICIIPGYDGMFGKPVHLYPILKNYINQANELFLSNKDHNAAWEQAGRLDTLMKDGGMIITQEEYEELHK